MEHQKRKITLSIDDVIDFCFCPRVYDIIHGAVKENKYIRAANVKRNYEKAIRKVFYLYITQLQHRERTRIVSPITFLKQEWAKEWIAQKTNSEIVQQMQDMVGISRNKFDVNVLVDSRRRIGIETLIRFEDIMQEPQYPLLVNYPYTINFSNGVALTGSIEYVREIKNEQDQKVIQLIHFGTRFNNLTTQKNKYNVLESNMFITASALAFKSLFNISKDVEMYIMDIHNKTLLPVTKTVRDFKQLQTTTESVAACIEQGIKCISLCRKCNLCPYHYMCL